MKKKEVSGNLREGLWRNKIRFIHEINVQLAVAEDENQRLRFGMPCLQHPMNWWNLLCNIDDAMCFRS